MGSSAATPVPLATRPPLIASSVIVSTARLRLGLISGLRKNARRFGVRKSHEDSVDVQGGQQPILELVRAANDLARPPANGLRRRLEAVFTHVMNLAHPIHEQAHAT